MTGAILHDICKVYELSYDRGFEYTDEGKLLGHISMEMEMVPKYINKIKGFPDKLKLAVQHMLLSHHSRLDFGSPKRPKIMEAMVLGYLDDLDSKINLVEGHVEGTEEGEDWTGFIRAMERPFYAGKIPFTPDSENAEVSSDQSSGTTKSTKKPEIKEDGDEEPSLFSK